VVNTLIGGGLLLARPLFSDAPNTRAIDQGGHYGASDRGLATGWGVVFAVIGLPALVVGIAEYAQIGEERQTRKSEEVMSSLDERCHLRPVDGKLSVIGSDGSELLSRQTASGRVELKADELRGKEVSHFSLDGHTVDVPASELSRLENFWACLSASETAGLPKLSSEEILERLSDARLCRQVEPKVADEAKKRLEEELVRQHEPLVAGDRAPATFDEVISRLEPSVFVTPKQNDLPATDVVEAKKGAGVFVSGVFAAAGAENILVVTAGAQRVLVFLPPDVIGRPAGNSIEVIGTISGTQKLGELVLPLVKAAAVR
jgi:hypothetical protein